MDMGTQGAGRKRLPNRERLTAEDDALNQIAREAEARLAAKRAARAEAREIRMKELERQQKEIYQVQKKYYGLDTKWGDIEQWMEDSERYSRRSRRNTSASDEDERMSVGSRGSLRTNGCDAELYGSQSLNRRSGRHSSYSGDSRSCTLSSSREETLPSYLYSAAQPAGSHRPSEHSGHGNSSSRAPSRASSARASPVVEERPEKDFTEKGSRSLPGLSAAALASLGGTSSRRGSGDTSISIDTEASIREIKELNELKDQIQDVEGKYMQGLKEMKDSLAEVEEKYKKAMVSNAQLDNEKTNFMYQVDTLKDTLLELEEQLAESRRQYEEKNKEFEREKHAHSLLQFQFAEVRAALKQRDEMLEEIRQLQQRQASYIREISDLQETVEWKDKKIGALERQKEFFDSIRTERDDLREEVFMLKEEIKKHGIILNSEIATNGETSDTLNNVGYQGPTKMAKEELNVLKATGDGTLGRANEVEVTNEIVENVGKREILQNTEQEQHKEDCVDTEVGHPGERAEGQKASEDSAPSPGALADATRERVQSQTLDSTSILEHTEQAGSKEVMSTPGGRTGALREQSECLGDVDSEIPGPRIEQGTCHALETNNQSENSAEEQEKQDFKTNSGEVSTEPHQESAPLPTSEVERVSSTDAGGPRGSPSQGVAEAGLSGLGEQAGTLASSPPRSSNDTVSPGENCEVGVPNELDPSTGRGLEEALTNQEVADSREVPAQSARVGGANDEEDEGRELRDETPAQTEVQTIPSSPAARSSAQETAGPRVVGAPSEALDTKERSEERKDRQGEALDSSQKKTKSKKKKNKKKKSPAPVETLTDVQKEPTCPSPGLGEVRAEEQVQPTDSKAGVETQNEVTEDPGPNTAAGGSESTECPGNPKTEVDGKLNQEDDDVSAKAGDVIADGDPLHLGGATIRASGTSASDKGLDDAVRRDDAGEDGTSPGSPPEPGDEEASSSALLGNESPSEDINDASQTEDIRLKKLVDERECLLEQIKKLKGQLEERQKNGKLDSLRPEDTVLENGTDMHVMDLQRDANRQISDLKFKLAKSEQEITALEQNVIRLESQVSRYKSAAENAEKIEDELKAEKRKLQRELRSALDKTEELEVSNGHLVKRLEKMKANRSALFSQQ